jgi:transposase
MMLRETVMQIKFLVQQGVAKSRIAERLGISRQSVYNHLARTEPFPKPRPQRPSKLDAFKEHIRARLERYDLPATVLLRELTAMGYEGGITILREFVRPLKAEFVRRVTERFETIPGAQAQLDWGECGTIMVDGQRRKLYVFVLVLGYSRMTYARFTTSTRLPALLDCLGRAFQALGIPAELLVDNMKQAVDQHDIATGTVRWNAKFLDFVEHFGVLPAASPPYWPRVKGKVERGVGYLKTSFLEGRSFTDLEDLNRQLEHWLDTVANVRPHRRVGVPAGRADGRTGGRADGRTGGRADGRTGGNGPESRGIGQLRSRSRRHRFPTGTSVSVAAGTICPRVLPRNIYPSAPVRSLGIPPSPG